MGWLWHTTGNPTSDEIGFYWHRGYPLLGNAISEAFYAQAAHQDIARWCIPEDGCQNIIILDATNLMWWATGKGVMIPVMFPGVQAEFDGYLGYQASDSAVTGGGILLLRQVGEADFQIVE